MTIAFNVQSGGSNRSRKAVLELVQRELDGSGLPYQPTEEGLLIEGSLDDALEAIQRCHDQARVHHSRVKTWFQVLRPQEPAGTP